MPIEINMKSSALKIKGQGVGSAYLEQVELIREMPQKFSVIINKNTRSPITHYHTVDLRFYLFRPFITSKGASVGYVHMLPETVDTSVRLPKLFKKVFYKYMISFYKHMDFLVTVNGYFIDVLSNKYGVPREKITYIPNYVSSDNFHPVPTEKKAQLRKKYGIDENAFVVMSAGQLQVRKGVFDFLKMAEKLPDITFVWAGGFSFGAFTDGYKEIQKVLENPPKNVKFLGIVDREYMNDVYNLADVMILASFEELFPMSILEAMCVGLPVLLRDLPIYEEILRDFYIKAHDVNGFVDCIKRLMSDKEFYSETAYASKRGNEFYSKDNIKKMWEDFYTMVYNSISEKKKQGNH